MESMIKSLLKRGHGNAIGAKRLSALTGLSDVEVRAEIRRLILEENMLIGSDSNGFYIIETAEELNRQARSLRHRGIAILVRASALQKISLEEIFQQARLEFKT